MGLFRGRGKKEGGDTNDAETGQTPKWSMGVLNDKNTVEVPGSVLLLAKDRNEPLGLRHAPARTSQSSLPTGAPFSRPGTPRRVSSSRAVTISHEAKKKTRDGKIILDPQPEDSANDPLNWPTWKRDTALLSLGFYCMVGGGITPILAAGFADVGHDYDVEVEQVALTTGLYMLGLGFGSVIASPTAILYGKRPVYLVSAFIFIASCVWCALSPSFGSLIAARILQGIAVSPVECLPSATIAEIFFLHERAFRIGIYTLLLLGGKNLVPLISALIIQSLGWRWVFCGLPDERTTDAEDATTAASNLKGETGAADDSKPEASQRPTQVNFAVDRKSSDSARSASFARGCSYLQDPRLGFGALDSRHPDLERSSQPIGGQHYTHNLREMPALTFSQQLRPYNGRLSEDSWFKVMLRPFVLFSYPAILWSAAVYACSVGWLIVISESMAMIYQNRDSYHFDALQTGLVYISPFVGGLLGTAVAGKVSDIIVKAMASRNGGLYEPEFRLVMGIPITITTVIGLMGFGWSAQERNHWIVPTVFFGVISFGCSLGSTTSITFCVDSYRQYAGEALVTLNFSKNVLHGFIFSLFFTHWLSSDGSRMVFIWTGVIQLILMLTTIPLYIYGKRLRMWTVRKNLLEKLLHS
ncbi:unnamed protein product [Parascedosporium putredinis]|uniref:Major facilitator superfamily (MFS) profile domain-containing protein n=1 Tax=Parascedosporium putredinis TaxID=1442378 RepID=A0A9P1GVB8_9PEZI|nr:unnamed protein product [Parascedosporium putredinis]CAI7988035.1 unnamed protein product [Parascedosporium putredinis]